jgi:hypothetical protein
VTHEYTLLTGGRVIRGPTGAEATAIAWAADTILAIGTDEEVRAISRGDSHFVDLAGRTVVPMSEDGGFRWPPEGQLEVGGRADLAVLLPGDDVNGDPRTIAVIKGGRIVSGSLPGLHG